MLTVARNRSVALYERVGDGKARQTLAKSLVGYGRRRVRAAVLQPRAAELQWQLSELPGRWLSIGKVFPCVTTINSTIRASPIKA